jgi:hypothetical protein
VGPWVAQPIKRREFGCGDPHHCIVDARTLNSKRD